MLYRIGTKSAIPTLGCRVPELVTENLLHYVSVLDAEYGDGRNYLSVGDHVLLAENLDVNVKIANGVFAPLNQKL